MVPSAIAPHSVVAMFGIVGNKAAGKIPLSAKP